MRRDMELVRKIIAIAINPQSRDALGYIIVDIDGYPPAVIRYHLRIMAQGGLIEIEDRTRPGDQIKDCRLIGIMPTGRHFWAVAKDDTAWQQVKEKVDWLGGAPFEVWHRLLSEYCKSDLEGLEAWLHG